MAAAVCSSRQRQLRVAPPSPTTSPSSKNSIANSTAATGDVYAKNLTGCPTVTNNEGTFGITNHWTILSSDFPKNDPTVRRPMTVDGILAFPEGATFSVDDDDAIVSSANGTVVATATDGIEGVPVCTGAKPRWKLTVSGNNLLFGPAYNYTLLIFQ